MKRHLDLPAAESTFCAAAFLPECVRNAIREVKFDYEDKIFYTTRLPAVFFACEISGIAEVIDLYSVCNNCTLDELNFHITSIMRELVSGGGDILHVENGVIECMWPLEHENRPELFRQILDLALYVQKEFGATRTKLVSRLKNNVGITTGEIELVYLGNYFAVGEAVKEARKGLVVCSKREVVVTKKFWMEVEPKGRYKWQVYDEDFVTVYSTPDSLSRIDEGSMTERHELLKRFDLEYADEMNKYLHPLCKSMQQLQTLSFVSQAVCVTVRLVNLDLKSSLENLQRSIDLVKGIVDDFEGVLTKITYRGDAILCILFGFPGFSHKDDPARGILCSQTMHKAFKEMNMKVCAVVSSGMVLCGVMGPPLRQECCVLGTAVNVGFQLIDQFPEFELMCCTNTFFRTSLIVSENFTPLERTIRGDLFFRIFPQQRVNNLVKCIGRKKEKSMIVEVLKNLKGGMSDQGDLHSLITVTGRRGSGRTTLVKWAVQEGKNMGYSATVFVTNNGFEEPSGNAWSIVQQILQRKPKILKLLGSEGGDLSLHKRINMSSREAILPAEGESEQEVMVDLVRQCTKSGRVLIAIDNAEHTGTESWLFLQCLLKERLACVMVTFTDEFRTSVPLVKCLLAKQYVGIDLGPITGDELGQLACSFLHVDAIRKAFTDFLQQQCGGNAFHLQEILMLPTLHKHFCLVSCANVSEGELKENFVRAEEESPDVKTARICDILDAEGLRKTDIPKDILDVVKDHTTGLNPEEQMLMKKCSLLGDGFGIAILEAVCPEYPSFELHRKVYDLVEKNILKFECDHWSVGNSDSHYKIVLGLSPLVYCIHPIRFTSDFLHRCVVKSMSETHRQQLNLYMADLLRKTSKSCDSCRKSSETKRNSPGEWKVPQIDLRLCKCLILRTDMLIQVEFHLCKGNADLIKRLHIMLLAAEAALDAKNVAKAEDVLNRTRKMMTVFEETEEPHRLKMAIERITARMKLQLGKKDDALLYLRRAMLSMNIVFPGDIKRVIKRFGGSLCSEEYKGLSFGCFLLIILREYEGACKAGKILLKFLQRADYSASDMIQAETFLLMAASKTRPGQRRERMTRKLTNALRLRCFKRLSEYPVLSMVELKVIVKALGTMLLLMFEAAALAAAEELGHKCFRLLKLVNYPKQLSRILFVLANVCLYQGNHVKCFEIISQLQDAYQQSGQAISEITYYIMLAEILSRTDRSARREDRIRMVSDFAQRGTMVVPSHPKYAEKVFCLSSKMALWCLQEKLVDAFPAWYEHALKLQKEMKLDNFWTLQASIYIVQVDLIKIELKFFIFVSDEMSKFKHKITKSIETIQKQVKSYVPVLDQTAKDLDKKLQSTLIECKILHG